MNNLGTKKEFPQALNNDFVSFIHLGMSRYLSHLLATDINSQLPSPRGPSIKSWYTWVRPRVASAYFTDNASSAKCRPVLVFGPRFMLIQSPYKGRRVTRHHEDA